MDSVTPPPHAATDHWTRQDSTERIATTVTAAQVSTTSMMACAGRAPSRPTTSSQPEKRSGAATQSPSRASRSRPATATAARPGIGVAGAASSSRPVTNVVTETTIDVDATTRHRPIEPIEPAAPKARASGVTPATSTPTPSRAALRHGRRASHSSMVAGT